MENLEQDNPRLNRAQKYIKDNKIMELFEDLNTKLSFEKPNNIRDFLIKELELKKKMKNKCTVFTESEIENIFNQYDLKQEGKITRFKTKEIQSSLASKEFQFEFLSGMDSQPDKVDLKTFKEISMAVFGSFM